MRRLTSLIISMMFAASGWAQSGMTDNQVVDFVIEQNAKGVSRQDIVTQLFKRGVTMEQLQRLKKKYERQMKNGALGAMDITAGSKEVKKRMREANGDKRQEDVEKEKRNVSSYRVKDGRKKTKQNTYDEKDKEFMDFDDAADFLMPDSLKYFGTDFFKEEEPKRKIFGHDLFNNEDLTFESSMNLATPQNYRLGAGDEVNIDIWGASQESISETISPDGYVTVEDIGLIQIGGLTVSQAKAKLAVCWVPDSRTHTSS